MRKTGKSRVPDPGRAWFWALALLAVCGIGGLDRAEAAELTGEEIMIRVRETKTPETSMAKVKMTLVNKRGKKREREMVTFTRKYGEDSKSLIRFLAPPDVRGTGFLTWENQGREDDQFLYLPALKRTRRIAASEKGASFMGTDFTYQDMQGREVEEDRHRLLGEEELGGFAAYRVESVPRDPGSSQYSKRISWIRKDIFFPVQVELFNRAGDLVKRLMVEQVEKVNGYWTARKTEMSNLRKESQTRIEVEEIEMGKPIPDEVFTQRYLERD